MSGPVRRSLAAVLFLLLVPGVSEVVENLVHVAIHGHAAHARPSGDRHSEPGPEHGCNGTFHLCSCHASLSYLVAKPLPPLRSRPPDALSRPRERASLHTGYHHIPERPPRV